MKNSLEGFPDKFYSKNFTQYGIDSKSLGWSKESQLIRFNKLIQISSLRDSSLLDVGCGFADLYFLLKQANLHPRKYLGLEPFEPFYKVSNKNLKNEMTAEVENIALEDFLPEFNFDVVVAIGICNLRIENNYEHLFLLIDKMILIAKNTVFVSVLSNSAPLAMQKENSETSFFYDDNIVIEYLDTLECRYVIHRGYLPHDIFLELRLWDTK